MWHHTTLVLHYNSVTPLLRNSITASHHCGITLPNRYTTVASNHSDIAPLQHHTSVASRYPGVIQLNNHIITHRHDVVTDAIFVTLILLQTLQHHHDSLLISIAVAPAQYQFILALQNHKLTIIKALLRQHLTLVSAFLLIEFHLSHFNQLIPFKVVTPVLVESDPSCWRKPSNLSSKTCNLEFVRVTSQLVSQSIKATLNQVLVNNNPRIGVKMLTLYLNWRMAKLSSYTTSYSRLVLCYITNLLIEINLSNKSFRVQS